MTVTLHASCAATPDTADAVLLIGPPGSGKSDLLLRLLDRGWRLVADDRVEIAPDGLARAPAALRGLIEVRGLGLLRLPAIAAARPVLAIRLGAPPERLPVPERLPDLDLPVVSLDGFAASAPMRVCLALGCALGQIRQIAGAFT